MVMSIERFTDEPVKLKCRTCGDTIKTTDKLLRQCRSCYLNTHGELK